MEKRPYPAWWIEQAGVRTTVLQAAVSRLRDSIASFSGLDGVLIYGSFARGDVGPESDLDVIILQETCLPFAARAAPLRRQLDDVLDVPYDLSVYTPEEFKTLSRSWPLIMEANAEGIWLAGG